MPYPSKKTNDLARAASALRKALKCAAELLEDSDPATRLKAVHGVATAAGTLAKLAEMTDFEAHARWPGMPTHTPEGWLLEALNKVRRYYPEPRERVALYAGNQPVAVVRRREGVRHAD